LERIRRLAPAFEQAQPRTGPNTQPLVRSRSTFHAEGMAAGEQLRAMNETTALDEVQRFLLTQAPVLLVSVGGLIVALRLWRKAPAASLWAAAAFALGILTCALVGVGQAVRSDVAYFISPILRAITCVLLLIGVYAGRPNPSATPAGAPESLWQSASGVVRARPGLLNVFFALFTSVFLLVVVTTTLVTFILPESFVSKARIVLRPPAETATEAPGPQGPSSGLDSRFLNTQCEIIQSELVLGKVIDDLDLNREWGKKFANGERLRTSETLALLRGRVDLRPTPNTSIIEIRSYSERPEEAAKIANAVAEAYRTRLLHSSSVAAISGGVRVELLDHAVPGFRPVRPNKPLNITLGVLIGLVLGLVVGGGAWYAGLTMRTRQPTKVAPE
jgi:capsular polysaccharide biosynthesis protein